MWLKYAFIVTLGVSSCAGAEPKSAQVMVVGTYDFVSSGLAIHNVKGIDVFTAERQSELDEVAVSLGRFQPNIIAVEWPDEIAKAQYAAFLRGELKQSGNEVVQIGFRLAAMLKLDQVHGIDVRTDFPFEELQAWARGHGRGSSLEALQQGVADALEKIGEAQSGMSIGAALRLLNSSAFQNETRGFYSALLEFGDGDEQPGAELNAAWARRNYLICARLLQIVSPGDRVVVLFGQGHVRMIEGCIVDAPGIVVVDPLGYLPQ